MPKPFVTVTILFFVLVNNGLRADSPLDQARPFLRQYCVQCHGPEEQEGDYRFDQISSDLSKVETLEKWQSIVDQLNLGEMPPKDHAQPDFEETNRIITLVTPVSYTHLTLPTTERV